MAITISSKTYPYQYPSIYYFLTYTNFFSSWIQYEIKNVAILHDTRPAPAAAGLPISKAGQLELVESNLPDLGSCATPVEPKVGGKAGGKPPSRRSSSDSSRSLLDPVRDIGDSGRSSRRDPPPSLAFSPPAGAGRRKSEAADGVRLALLPPSQMSPVPCPFAVCFHHPSDRVVLAALVSPRDLRC